jgi:xanthine/uracil permease
MSEPTTNPYEAPESTGMPAGDPQPAFAVKKATNLAMRYVTAIGGAVFMFFAVLLLSMLITPYLPPFVRVVFIGPVHVSIGLLLAPIAAFSSYRSTLHHYRKKDDKGRHP